MSQEHRPRAGYTLIELIVVIAIVGTLLGLLLPAVQNVRAAAARIRCGNQMRQLALAAHQFHDSFETLPPAFNGRGSTSRLNWHVKLLPFIEQDAAWQATLADFQREPNPYSQTKPHGNFDKLFAAYECPADSRTATAWTVQTMNGPRHVSVSSYLGNSGAAHGDRQGVIYRNSRIGLAHILDGSSNTLLMGERPPSYNLLYGWWYAGAGQDGRGSLDSVLAARERNRSLYPSYQSCGDGPFPMKARRVDEPCSAFHYWSFHGGGLNLAFCDGSVRFSSYSIDGVLPELATRSGGEPVGVPD
ncbi:MAG: DUF1559 domain-containing protein [Gemmataceae bacterium]|nr:DUF1559 domain-containing protein [Planctomycetia bacterium]MBX3400105.1 DUF1559 domain-containing protein [Gemmataceae bacterium]